MTHPEPAPSGAQTALTIALLGAALCTAFEAYGTVTAMPVAAEDLGRIELYAWGFTAFLIAQVLAIVLSGRLSDRKGPVVPLVGGSAIFVIGLLAAGLAPTMEVLLAGRFVQGFGAGTSNVAFMVVFAQAYDARRRAAMMSLLSFAWVLPSFLGPPLAAWLTETWSWHWVFLGVVPFLVGVLSLGARPLLELHRRWRPHDGSTNPVPVWAAFAAAIGAALVQLAGQRLAVEIDLLVVVLAIAGLVVLLAGLPALMPAGFMRLSTGLPSLMATRGLAAGAFFAAESFVVLLLREQHGFSLRSAGLFLAIGSTGWALGSVVQASRWLRIRRDQIVQAGMIAIAAGLALCTVTAWLGWHWLLLAAGFTISGFGMGLAVASTSLANMQISEPHLIGRNTSSLQVSEGLGNSLITGLAGTIFASLHLRADASGTYTPIYLAATLVSLLGLATALRIGPVRNDSAGVG